jgi:drug/metabolite transporter (DMT)-like permease
MIALWFSPRIREGERKRRGALYALAAGLVAGIGNLGYYKGVAAGAQASVAVSLTALYPAAAIAIAFFVLRERPNRVQALGIAAALGAMYLLNAGGAGETSSPWLLYALVPIVLWGASAVLTKVATDHASAELGALWFLAAFLPISALLLVLEPMTWGLPAIDWLLLALLGFTYGYGNLTVLAAYRCEGKASIVTPLAGLYPVVTIALAILFCGEEVQPRQWAGIGLALVAVIGLVHETKPGAPVPGEREISTAEANPL